MKVKPLIVDTLTILFYTSIVLNFAFTIGITTSLIMMSSIFLSLGDLTQELLVKETVENIHNALNLGIPYITNWAYINIGILVSSDLYQLFRQSSSFKPNLEWLWKRHFILVLPKLVFNTVLVVQFITSRIEKELLELPGAMFEVFSESTLWIVKISCLSLLVPIYGLVYLIVFWLLSKALKKRLNVRLT